MCNLSSLSIIFLLDIPAPCCPPPRRRATGPSARGMRRVTLPAPSATSTCGGCSISDRWTSSLPSGRCFTCSPRRRGSTATSTTESRPRTSGPGTTPLSLCCSASGCVVRLHPLSQVQPAHIRSLPTFTVIFVPCSVDDRLWSGAGHGSPGDPEAAAVGGLC